LASNSAKNHASASVASQENHSPNDATQPATVTKGKTLVIIFLRGGADGLNLVIPHGDEHYRKLRRAIAIPKPGDDDPQRSTIDLDGYFGLHPRLRPLHQHFNSGLAIAAYAVDAFARDLEDQMDDVLLITLTDFGRTAAENGTNGTDHGWANCMFLLGGPVRKANKANAAHANGKERKVVTNNWPSLAPDQLHEGRDLLHTTDFRDVLAEVVSVHLGNKNLKTILPSHNFKPVDLVS